MKRFKLLPVLFAGILIASMTSCENQGVEFPNYEGGTTVYFAYQYPVRTIVLGDDTYDTTLDNEHRCEIYATMGGVYKNQKNISIDIAVDNGLCDNLFFEDGSPVQAMPSNYYTLAGSKIILDKKIQGSVGVQLQDAFFSDPDALKKTYVIPLLMTKVQNADSILSGRHLIQNAPRTYSEAWDIQPQDYVLYAVKFINPWHAKYLRRGVDLVTENGATAMNVRRKPHVENDELCSLTTASLKVTKFPVKTTVSDGLGGVQTLTCDLLLTFNDNNECTISTDTQGYTASGSGKFVKNGEKNSWGNKDRNAMYLEYNINFGSKQYVTKDTLVVQTRGIDSELFVPTYKTNHF